MRPQDDALRRNVLAIAHDGKCARTGLRSKRIAEQLWVQALEPAVGGGLISPAAHTLLSGTVVEVRSYEHDDDDLRAAIVVESHGHRETIGFVNPVSSTDDERDTGKPLSAFAPALRLGDSVTFRMGCHGKLTFTNATLDTEERYGPDGRLERRIVGVAQSLSR